MEEFRLIYSGFSTLFLPGLLFLVAGRGLRGVKFWEIALYSFIGSIVSHGIFLFVFGVLLRAVDLLNVLAGYIEMTGEGLKAVINKPYGSEVLASFVTTSVVSWTTGILCRWLSVQRNGFFFKKPFSIEPRSALDIEMARLRDGKKRPIVTIRFASGEEIKGRCRVYTFTEPREIILETEGGAPVKTLRWVVLNESVSEVRLEVPDEDAKVPGGKVFSMPRIRSSRRSE